MPPLNELIQTGPAHRLDRRWFGAQSTRRRRALLALAMTLAAGWMTWVSVQVFDERQQTKRLKDASQRIELLQVNDLSAQQALPRMTTRQASTVAKAIDRLNVPWRQVLDDLERHTPSSVALLEVEPESGGGTVRLLVEARAPDDVFLYLDSLKAAVSLRNGRVLKYEINMQDAARPARFLLQVDVVREPTQTPTRSGRALTAAVSMSGVAK